MTEKIHIKLRSWDFILDEQREVVSTRLTRGGDLCCRKLTLGAAMGGVDLNSSDLGRETSVSLLGVTLLGEGVSAPETLTEWKNQPAINQSA